MRQPVESKCSLVSRDTHGAPAGWKSIEEAYAICKRITRRHGPNFSLGFIFLPRPKQNAIHAIYAFCRIADDIADEESSPRKATLLQEWQEELDRSFTGRPTHPVAAALADAARHYPIPGWPFRALIDGCRDDLTKSRYATFDELLGYCEKVAATISVLSLAVMGAKNREASEHGKLFSTALQLTNVIRDVGSDVDRGRIYLPQDEIARFGCTEKDILAKRYTPQFRALMEFNVERAFDYFDLGYPVVREVEPDSCRAVHIMGAVYCAVLEKIRRGGCRVLDGKTSLGPLEKLMVIAGSFRRNRKGFRNG